MGRLRWDACTLAAAAGLYPTAIRYVPSARQTGKRCTVATATSWVGSLTQDCVISDKQKGAWCRCSSAQPKTSDEANFRASAIAALLRASAWSGKLEAEKNDPQKRLCWRLGVDVGREQCEISSTWVSNFRRTAVSRISRVPRWRSSGSLTSSRGRALQPSRSTRIHRNARCEAEALCRGITVFVPTPRLRRGFKKLDPHRIPPDKIDEAASLSHVNRWSEEVTLAEVPTLDAIVCGSVAVTRGGRRCGKGEGYSDLEFAILRELGHPIVPVATTVHDLQIVASVPRDPTDQPLSVIATPTHAIRIKRPSAAPTGIDWTRFQPRGPWLEMPILAELKRMTTSNA